MSEFFQHYPQINYDITGDVTVTGTCQKKGF